MLRTEKQESIATPVDLYFNFEVVKLGLLPTLYFLFEEIYKPKPSVEHIQSLIIQISFDLKTFDLMLMIDKDLKITEFDQDVLDRLKR